MAEHQVVESQHIRHLIPILLTVILTVMLRFPQIRPQRFYRVREWYGLGVKKTTMDERLPQEFSRDNLSIHLTVALAQLSFW